MKLLIREATPDDAKALIAYLNMVGGESDNLTFGKDEFWATEEQERSFLQSQMESPINCMLVGILDGQVVSSASISGFDRPRLTHRGSIGISVAQSHWGQGIGRAMMEALIVRAKGAGLSILELEVRTDNVAAVHLYESLGFRRFGVYKNYMRIDGTYFDCAYMTLEL